MPIKRSRWARYSRCQLSGFLVVETHVVLKEDEAARRRLEHRISLLREADRSVIRSSIPRAIRTRMEYHVAGSTCFQSPCIRRHKLLIAPLVVRDIRTHDKTILQPYESVPEVFR